MMNDIVLFKNGELELEVKISPDEDTVWLTQQQMSTLFNSSRSNIVEHIANIYKEGELDENATCRDFRQVRKEGKRTVARDLPHYNLDVIISAGYRVKSQRGIAFRKWATSVLKEYMTKGYAINQKRLEALNKTIQIQSRILASTLELNGILEAVYQNVFGQELYPSIEDKAANLLYFLIKDHPFADGCKRIGATIFLEFLNKNKHLFIDGKQIISDSALVAITLMIAESKPEEKETMVRLVMNFLTELPA